MLLSFLIIMAVIYFSCSDTRGSGPQTTLGKDGLKQSLYREYFKELTGRANHLPSFKFSRPFKGLLLLWIFLEYPMRSTVNSLFPFSLLYWNSTHEHCCHLIYPIKLNSSLMKNDTNRIQTLTIIGELT